MHLFPVAGEFAAELFLGGDPQGLVREQVHACRRIRLGVARICGGSRLKAAPEHAAQDGVELMRGRPGKSRQVAPGQAASGPCDVTNHVDRDLIAREQVPQFLLGAQFDVLGHPRHRQAMRVAGAQRVI